MKMEQTQCSETSAIKHLTPENNPKITHDILVYLTDFSTSATHIVLLTKTAMVKNNSMIVAADCLI
jgi:hypothetical protein